MATAVNAAVFVVFLAAEALQFHFAGQSGTTKWPKLSANDIHSMYGVPLGFLLLTIVWLNFLWPAPAKTTEKKPDHQILSATESEAAAIEFDTKVAHVFQPGESAGDYDADWKTTFDIHFLVFMIILFGALIGLTVIYEPELLRNPLFWRSNGIKITIMCTVSIFGGVLCRIFGGGYDKKGYIIGGKKQHFKVNYTRKFQHFAAYAVPLLIHTDIKGWSMLHLVWGDFFTLLGFLVQIKPLREAFMPFMLMFNSLDRPEDRPHCLKWIIGGNILPGLALIIFFDWLYTRFGIAQQHLVMIFVLVAGVGDGLAEPVGIYFGKHKYKTRSCTSTRKYTRSFEGSSCVFLSTFLWIIMYRSDIESRQQFWLLMAILPMVMTLAEATSPHTMDTPLLMGLGGAIIYVVLRWF